MYIETDEVKSVNLMKKLGMSFEGVQHIDTGDLGGNGAELYVYGMLRENYEKCKKNIKNIK